MNHQTAYNIFLVVLVFQIDALSIHQCKIIIYQFAEQVSINQETHIAPAVGTI